MVGGYKLIDFKNININPDEPMKIEGVANAIESSFKPLVITGLKVSDVEIKPVNAIFSFESPYTTDIDINGVLMAISVSDDDFVTISIKE